MELEYFATHAHSYGRTDSTKTLRLVLTTLGGGTGTRKSSLFDAPYSVCDFS